MRGHVSIDSNPVTAIPAVSLSSFHAGGNRVLFPSVIAPWPKRAIWFVVICGSLYVLISPLPELDTTLSGNSALIFVVFVLVIDALLGLRALISLAGGRPLCVDSSWQTGFLAKICLRLC